MLKLKLYIVILDFKKKLKKRTAGSKLVAATKASEISMKHFQKFLY